MTPDQGIAEARSAIANKRWDILALIFHQCDASVISYAIGTRDPMALLTLYSTSTGKTAHPDLIRSTIPFDDFEWMVLVHEPHNVFVRSGLYVFDEDEVDLTIEERYQALRRTTHEEIGKNPDRPFGLYRPQINVEFGTNFHMIDSPMNWGITWGILEVIGDHFPEGINSHAWHKDKEKDVSFYTSRSSNS